MDETPFSANANQQDSAAPSATGASGKNDGRSPLSTGLDGKPLTHWLDDVVDEIRWDARFTFRGKKALLLGVLKTVRDNILWLAYENHAVQMDRSHAPRNIRNEYRAMENAQGDYFIDSIRIGDMRADHREGGVCDAFGCLSVNTDSLERVMRRVETCAGIENVTPRTINIGRYHFPNPLDFDALRAAAATDVSFDFRECAVDAFYETPFTLPLDGGTASVGYVDPATGCDALATVGNVALFDAASGEGRAAFLEYLLPADVPGALARNADALLADADAGGRALAVVDYSCAHGNAVAFYTEECLYASRPKRYPYRAVSYANDLCGAPPFAGKGRCCVGFVDAGTEACAARLFLCRHLLPLETVALTVVSV